MAEPRATYRIQLHAGVGFDDVADLAPYLADLGVSHVYTSPYLQAAPGSTHGYDVVDHTRVSEELGGADAHARMVKALGAAGLGHVLDIVPNHMAITPENRWWWDVLENGPSSRYASYFDVDWDPPDARMRNRVLMPILGDHYGAVLDAGDITLERDGGGFLVRYHDHTLPVSPRSLDSLLGLAAARSGSDELAFLAEAAAALPHSSATDRTAVTVRHRDKEVLRYLLARLLEAEDLADAIDAVVAETNADADLLDALLERQNYRLAHWRTAGRELDYRRFFDITTLVGLRAEDEQVFHDTHALVLDLVASGAVDGLRIDHPDGLRDPAGYFRRLAAAAPDTWIVIEKILELGERLPEAWPVAGTTGYEFLNRVGGLFVDPDGVGPLTDIYSEFTGRETNWETVSRESRHFVMREVLAADLIRLSGLFARVCEGHRRFRDYASQDLHEIVREVIASLDVYRTYARAETGEIDAGDVARVERAVTDAAARRPDLDPDLFAFLRDLVALRIGGDVESELVMRFQQVTGAVMAKGVEDTAFYTYNRYVAVNEVGGDPGHLATSADELHRACADAQRSWPTGMLATSTHDTKRSEDVRARLWVLSEILDEWRDAVARWSELAEPHRTDELPDRNTEYLLWQAVAGAWPIGVERVLAFTEKAAREAKEHTSWTAPDEVYERALRSFVNGVMSDDEITRELAGFVARIEVPARANSLGQKLISLTAPGVPDIYQGTELWDHSLVDPDNRRPVDFDARRAALAAPDRLRAEHPKLWVVRQALDLRRRRPELFGPDAGYEPLAAAGDKAAHVFAFARGGGAVTVVSRFTTRLEGWGQTFLQLPVGRYHDVLGGVTKAGGLVPLSHVFGSLPVALFERVA